MIIRSDIDDRVDAMARDLYDLGYGSLGEAIAGGAYSPSAGLLAAADVADRLGELVAAWSDGCDLCTRCSRRVTAGELLRSVRASDGLVRWLCVDCVE